MERWYPDETETLEEWERMFGVWPSRFHDENGEPVPAMDAIEIAEIITRTMFAEETTKEHDPLQD